MIRATIVAWLLRRDTYSDGDDDDDGGRRRLIPDQNIFRERERERKMGGMGKHQ